MSRLSYSKFLFAFGSISATSVLFHWSVPAIQVLVSHWFNYRGFIIYKKIILFSHCFCFLGIFWLSLSQIYLFFWPSGLFYSFSHIAFEYSLLSLCLGLWLYLIFAIVNGECFLIMFLASFLFINMRAPIFTYWF